MCCMCALHRVGIPCVLPRLWTSKRAMTSSQRTLPVPTSTSALCRQHTCTAYIHMHRMPLHTPTCPTMPCLAPNPCPEPCLAPSPS